VFGSLESRSGCCKKSAVECPRNDHRAPQTSTALCFYCVCNNKVGKSLYMRHVYLVVVCEFRAQFHLNSISSLNLCGLMWVSRPGKAHVLAVPGSVAQKN
jgi:hypothetical protein